MKALVSAFALLSFVAATTIPYVAHAAQTTQSTPKKSKTKKKTTKKAVHKKVAPKKASKKKPTKKATT